MDGFTKSALFWVIFTLALIALMLVAISFECGPLAIIFDLVSLAVTVAFITDMMQDSLMFND